MSADAAATPASTPSPKAAQRRPDAGMRTLKSVGYSFGLPILLIVAWGLWATLTKPKFFPTPAGVYEAFVDTWVGPIFVSDVLPSLLRLAIGLLASIAIGIVFGTIIGLVKWLRELLEPSLEFFRAIPPPVMVPVIAVILGQTGTMKVVVIILGAVWPVLLNTIEGVRSTDSVMKDTARAFGLTRSQRLRDLVLPAAMPRIMTGVRQAMSIGLILMVISEMFNASSGLGGNIVYFQRNYLIDEMWSGIVLLGLLGVLLAAIFSFVERRMLSWYHGVKEVERG